MCIVVSQLTVVCFYISSENTAETNAFRSLPSFWSTVGFYVTSQTHGGNGQRDRVVSGGSGGPAKGHFRLPVGAAQDKPPGCRRRQRASTAATGAAAAESSTCRDSTGRLPRRAAPQGHQLIASRDSPQSPWKPLPWQPMFCRVSVRNGV